MQEPFIPIPSSPIDSEILEVNVEIPADFKSDNHVVLGIILDFSLRHHADSRRFIDIAKEQIIKLLLSLEGDDKAYVFYQDQDNKVASVGQVVSQVADYKMSLYFNPLKAIQSSLQVIEAEDRDCRKVLFYITDRAVLKYDYNIVLALKKRKLKHDCEVYVVKVGNRCDDSLSQLKVNLVNAEANSIFEVLSKILKD